jgi:hypothetical protein
MSSYVKSTNFASKDSLAIGNPLKIVKGTEIDAEFNNIATAVETKADIANPTFTGTVAAPTPALSAAGTTVATVAAIQALYPVGSIYINAGVTTNPATLLGFGTWAAFGAGRVMIGLNGSDALFDTLEETGGSKDATLVSHNHTFSGTTASAGTHQHYTGNNFEGGTPFGNATARYGFGDGWSGNRTANGSGTGYDTLTNSAGAHDHTYSGTTSTQGSSATNANLQPYITVAMWKRTA